MTWQHCQTAQAPTGARHQMVQQVCRLGLLTALNHVWSGCYYDCGRPVSKRGMFIPCRKDMTADDLFYVFLREVIQLKGRPRRIISDQDKLFESQAWKELAHRLKIEMHQTEANRPGANGLVERSNQSILQRMRTHGIFGNIEWDVDLLFGTIEFNNLTSNSLRPSPLEIDKGWTPQFPLDVHIMTSHAHEPSTLSNSMHRA